MSDVISGPANDAGVSVTVARIVVVGALRRLHRISVTDPMGLTAVALESVLQLGPEACWHLFGMLEEQRTRHDRDESWSETLLRLDPTIYRFDVLREKWLTPRPRPEDQGK